MNARYLFTALVVTAGLVVAPGSAVFAEEEPDDEDGVRCIRLDMVSRTEIIDPRTIVFHMRGRDIYRNRLPGRCPGLRPGESLMYRSTSSQLCKMDSVSVVHTWGGGLSPGISCRLGTFIPISEKDVDALKEPQYDIEPREVPGAKPEEIGSPEEEADDHDSGDSQQ